MLNLLLPILIPVHRKTKFKESWVLPLPSGFLRNSQLISLVAASKGVGNVHIENENRLLFTRYGTGTVFHSRLTSNGILLSKAPFLDPELMSRCKCCNRMQMTASHTCPSSLDGGCAQTRGHGFH